MKVVRINERQLRALITNVIEEAGAPMPMKHVKLVQQLVDNLTTAKQTLSLLYQASSSPEASSQAETLLDDINGILRGLDQMPELTKGWERGKTPSFRPSA